MSTQDLSLQLPEDVLRLFWHHIDSEKSDMWYDLAGAGWVADNIVLAVFVDSSVLGVFYRVTLKGLEGVVVPQPHRTMFNIRDPRSYVAHRLSRTTH